MPSCTHQGQRRHGCRQGRLGHPAECTQLAPGGELDLATDACCGCHADGARLCRHSAKLLHSGAAFLGTTRANLLMLLGVCKLLALLDLWVVNAIPRVTCLCVACMMGAPSATYHGVLASHQYLCRVLAHRPCTRVYTDWFAHGLGRSGHLLPPRHRRRPAAARAHVRRYAIRCTHTHGARHLVLTARLQAASLSTRGCIPTRMQRLQPYP